MFKREIVVDDVVYKLYKPLPWYIVKDNIGRSYHVFVNGRTKIAVHEKAVLFDVGDTIEFYTGVSKEIPHNRKINKLVFWKDKNYCGLNIKVVLFEDDRGNTCTFEYITSKSIREKFCKYLLE